MQMALGLGFVLAAALLLGRDVLPSMFSKDLAVCTAIASLLPAAALSQPLNCLAFVMDGVLYGKCKTSK